MNDVELLEQHRGGCEQAFADLVRRHLGWIYGMARRRLRDDHLAEDVSQAVFVLLHRKAPRFPNDGAMVSWLHKTTWYATEVAARNERRRQHRETEAAILQPASTDRTRGQTDEWEELAPLLDELIGKLSRTDRQAILLRYYRDMTFAEVGAQIGSSEEAARKRVDRAVEKLRHLAKQKAVEISAPSLGAGLLAHVRLPPPHGLISTTTTAATAPAGSAIAAASATIVKGTIFMMTSAKLTIVAATVVGGLVLGCSAIWMGTPSNRAQSSQATPVDRSPRREAGQWASDNAYPKLSPFTAIRWRGETTEVQVSGMWYELQALDDRPAPQIVAYARQVDPKDWQKRVAEDLVELLARMGHQPGNTVTLQLRALDTNTSVTMKDVPMTHENRQMIWQQRNL